MSINISFDDAYNFKKSNSTSAKEFKDYANMIAVEEYTSAKTANKSIRITFEHEGLKVYSYLGLSDKSIKYTIGSMLRAYAKSTSEDKAKEIFEKINADDEVESELDFAIELKNRLNKKLTSNPVRVWVERKKEGEFYQVQWYFEKPADKTEDVAAAIAEENKVNVSI